MYGSVRNLLGVREVETIVGLYVNPWKTLQEYLKDTEAAAVLFMQEGALTDEVKLNEFHL